MAVCLMEGGALVLFPNSWRNTFSAWGHPLFPGRWWRKCPNWLYRLIGYTAMSLGIFVGFHHFRQ